MKNIKKTFPTLKCRKICLRHVHCTLYITVLFTQTKSYVPDNLYEVTYMYICFVRLEGYFCTFEPKFQWPGNTDVNDTNCMAVAWREIGFIACIPSLPMHSRGIITFF